jgi:hypothetical protein
MTNLLNEIKNKAIQDFKNCGTYYGAHSEEIAGHKVQAYVSKQSKGSNRRYDSLVCNWYLDNKKSSLAKVLEAIS